MGGSAGFSRRNAALTPAAPRLQRALEQHVRSWTEGPSTEGEGKALPSEANFRSQSWPGEAGPQLQGPGSTETKAGEQQHLQLCLGVIAMTFPSLEGPGTFFPPSRGQLLPALSFYPPPASTKPRDPVWYQTFVMSCMQTSSATQAEGLITRTARVEPWTCSSPLGSPC